MFAEVLLREPCGEFTDGRMFIIESGMEWQRVEYREPAMCSCSINVRLRDEGLVPHDGSKAAWERMWNRQEALSLELGVDGSGSTVCRDCRELWEIDHFVRGPW